MQVTFKNDILNALFTATSTADDASAAKGMPDVYSAFGGRVMLLGYSGNISLFSMAMFKPSAFATLTGNSQQVVVCLENVSEFSRSALGALVDFAAAVLGRGKNLYLLAPPPGLVNTLKELQLTMFFDILEDQDELMCVLPDE